MSAGLYVFCRASVRSARITRMRCVLVRGRARFRGEKDQEVSAGSVLYVAAEAEHRFYDIAEELVVLVFFAPAES
jgi:hypothetical protein